VSFTIPTRVGIESVRISRYTGLGSLSLTVRFTANTKEARVTVRLRLVTISSAGRSLTADGRKYINAPFDLRERISRQT